MKKLVPSTVALTALCLMSVGAVSAADIVHDSEYYVLEAQNGERWTAEDNEIDAKLAQLREKYGQPPNIIHVMWDATSFGDVGIPTISKIRGFETQSIHRMADEGIMFTRMYTESGLRTLPCSRPDGPARGSFRDVHHRIPRRVLRDAG